MWLLRTVRLRACEMCLVCVSLSKLGAEGEAAMASALQHLTSLTVLKYVCEA
jgi:hypothetical protein